MKKIFKTIISILLIVNNYRIYPQAMCINYITTSVESAVIVDNVIKENSEFLNIDVVIPQIINISDKEKEKDINNEILAYTNMWINEAKENSQELKPTIPYEMVSRYYLTNEEEVLSFYIDYYQFSGGAHGITIRKAYNINTTTGEKVLLSDLFEEGCDYKSYINNEIEKQINEYPEEYFTGKEGFNGIKENQDFYIKDDKLVIFFPYYEIAPYASGMPEFIIDINN